ncbi:MAG: MFS transporter [Azospirillum sp.]|nr:MFS transporter [Azospirillum sp.]
MIAAEILSMAGFSPFAVTMPELIGLWRLTPSEAGWIHGAYFAGYVAAVPLLVGLTDRWDARAIYLLGCLAGVAAGLGFARYADGLWPAIGFRALAGAGLAGTYMPGLRILTERLGPQARLRAVPYYTASFGIGVSLSFLAAGWIDQRWGWSATYLAGSAGAALSVALLLVAVIGTTRQAEPVAAGPRRHPLDFRPVFTNRGALGYILAYGGHCWELFALRSWIVAFLLFAWSRSTSAAPGEVVTHWVTVIVLVGVPSSILGAELALRRRRRPLVLRVCGLTVAAGLACGALAGFGFPAVVAAALAYSFLITADSGALTAGAVDQSRPGEQGATLAVHSLIGFTGGALGPIAAGTVLQIAGGLQSALAWAAALAVMAAGSAAAGLALYLAKPPAKG